MAIPLRAIVIGLALAILSGLTGCSTNPATGKSSFMLQSWDWERSLAAQAGPEFTNEYGGQTPDTQCQAYVREIGGRLTEAALAQAHAEVPELEWDYTLLDSGVINAFALPGGKVYISRGLAAKLENEAQLAGVLGHEVGHVMARHGNQQASKQILFNAGMALGAVAVGTADKDSKFSKYGQYAIPALTVGGNVVLLSYGRDEELEADKLGIQYMTANGYNPVAQRQVMQILESLAGSSAPPEWLSTHPAADTRIARINEMLKGEYAYTQNNPQYGLFADRYRSRMLDRLAKLPPPAQGASQSSDAFDLHDPGTWCPLCAAERALAGR